MKPVFQTRFGKEGNCWPACLASLFEVPLEEVDHLACQHDEWRERTDAWLASRGLFYVEIPWTEGGNFPTTCLPDGATVIAGCWTQRGFPHVVIARVQVIEHDARGQASKFELHIAHDPHPKGGQLEKVDGIMIFAALHQ